MKDQQAGASPPLGIVLVVSAATGGLAWAACYPFDAVKSVQQGVPLNGNEVKFFSVFFSLTIFSHASVPFSLYITGSFEFFFHMQGPISPICHNPFSPISPNAFFDIFLSLNENEATRTNTHPVPP